MKPNENAAGPPSRSMMPCKQFYTKKSTLKSFSGERKTLKVQRLCFTQPWLFKPVIAETPNFYFYLSVLTPNK